MSAEPHIPKRSMPSPAGLPNPEDQPEPTPEVRERVLREALASWREQGLLSADQHDVLLAHIAPSPAPAQPSGRRPGMAQERTLGRGVTILISLGAIILDGAIRSDGGTLLVLLGQERYGGPVHLAELREDGTVIRRGPEILPDRVLGFDSGTASAWVIAGTPTAYARPPFHVQRMTLEGLTGPHMGPFASRPRRVLAADRGLWVVEPDQHRVSHLDLGGTLVSEYRDLNRPSEIAVDRGSLMVIEAGQTQLTRFGPDGTAAWRLPRFQGLAWIVPDPETGGGWVGAVRYESAEGGIFRYEADRRIARLPAAISPRILGDGIRNRLTPDAIRDQTHDRFYIGEGQGIAILGGDGRLLKRVQAFRYATPRPLPN